MDELIQKATKFLQENPYINEIELTDGFNNKVKIVKNAPVIYQAWPSIPNIQFHSFGYQIPEVK